MVQNTSPEDSENLRALWSNTTEDIRFFKSQQYSVTNYGLALLAGMIALRTQFMMPPSLPTGWRIAGRLLFAAIALAVGWKGAEQIGSLQASMNRTRKRANCCRDELSNASVSLKRCVETVKVQTVPDGADEQQGDVKTTLMIVLWGAAAAAAASVLVPLRPN